MCVVEIEKKLILLKTVVAVAAWVSETQGAS